MTHAGPHIATDGLVLNLDAANPKSYPGTGTTWYDLSPSGFNANLADPPTHNSAGYFSFDGLTNYADVASGLQTSIENASTFTVMAFAYVTSIAHVSNIIGWGNANASGGVSRTWGIYEYSSYLSNMYSSNANTRFGTRAEIYNKWIFYVGRYEVSKTYTDSFGEREVNLEYDLPASMSWKSIPTSYPIRIGKISYSSSTSYMTQMLLSHIICYDRMLTDAEIRQNYDAVRGRQSL